MVFFLLDFIFNLPELKSVYSLARSTDNLFACVVNEIGVSRKNTPAVQGVVQLC